MDWSDRVGGRIKLRDLHILLVVAECRSMTKAAKRLAVSNPVVSKAIADMEHALKVRLLDRSPQGIEPTIYGHVLLNHGLAAFDELKRGVKQIEYLADPTAGELHVGATIAIATSFLAAVIDRFSRQYPRTVIHLTAAGSEMTYRALDDRAVDLVLARVFSPVDDDRTRVDILFEDYEVVVAGAQNPWARRRKVQLADLMKEPWTLAPPESLSGAMIVEAFRAAGLEMPQATVVTNTVPVRNALLETGRFLTIIPNSVLRFSPSSPVLKRLPIQLPTTRRSIGITTIRNRTLSPVAQLFIEHAREVARPLAMGEL